MQSCRVLAACVLRPRMASRSVYQGDGLAWLRERRLAPDQALITSLPDVSELPALGFDGWRDWFIEAAATACAATDESAVSLFFQTDIKREGTWVDKAYLVQRGAEAAGAALLWHKIVCRAPAGTTCFGRPGYAHLLCFSKALRIPPGRSVPDLLPHLGEMSWSRAMGAAVCDFSCRFLLSHTACTTVVDPFCGMGSVLAVANGLGLDAIGVELSRKRARRARALTLSGSAATAHPSTAPTDTPRGP